jgi:hypothetical protein
LGVAQATRQVGKIGEWVHVTIIAGSRMAERVLCSNGFTP